MARETTKSATVAETAETPAEAPKSEQKVQKESVYSIKELAANARKIFGTRQECVVAALKVDGKSQYTVSEAKVIVEKFLKKEVKYVYLRRNKGTSWFLLQHSEERRQFIRKCYEWSNGSNLPGRFRTT